MDNSRGYPAPPTREYIPEQRPPEPRADFRREAYEPGSPLRRLEADMGLPQGYLAIPERSGARDRVPPAPLYPQPERQNPRPGTIPNMGDTRPQEYRQPYYDARRDQDYDRKPQPGYYNPQQQYYDRRQQAPCDPRQQQYDQRYQQQQYYDPRQQQYDQRYQQQQYYDPRQQQYDPRYQQQYYDPRQQQYDQRYQQQGDYYKQQWWEQAQNPNYNGQRFQPGRNPELNRYQQQWWEQSQNPGNPSQRFVPGRNPQLDAYRQQWWDRANTPPGYDNRNRNQVYDQSQAFSYAINSLLGHAVQEYDQTVPSRLGCARAVSLALERTYGLPIREQGCEALEQTIQRYGWIQVDPQQMQPGDVIIGSRGPGQYGHSAIYVGNDQVYNNNSNSGRIQIDSLSKFRSREFVRVAVYRKAR
ncbi:MAG: C40 family peptidase [Candidatus Obscuribacterales bacterium]|nr:C40 family peptidase [Candidatus Obscuribacterales bacterium]